MKTFVHFVGSTKRPERVYAKLGKYRYTLLTFYLIEKKSTDWEYLAVKVLQTALEYVPLPFNHYINRDFRRILSNFITLKRKGYIKMKFLPLSAVEKKLLSILRILQKKKINKEIKWKKFNFKWLNFEDLLKGATLPFFVVGERLIMPATVEVLMERTDYKETTIREILKALKLLGLAKNWREN